MTKSLETLYVGVLKKGLALRCKQDGESYLVELLLPDGKVVNRVTLVPNSFLDAISFSTDGKYSTFFNELQGANYASKSGDGGSEAAPPPVPIYHTAPIINVQGGRVLRTK